jgi:hypothetical protein
MAHGKHLVHLVSVHLLKYYSRAPMGTRLPGVIKFWGPPIPIFTGILGGPHFDLTAVHYSNGTIHEI